MERAADACRSMHEWEGRPFRRSLEVLAEIAVQATGAQGYTFLRNSRDTGLLIRGGGPIPLHAGQAGRTPGLVEYPLRDGVSGAFVAFLFPGETEAAQARARLDRIAAAIQTVWSAAAAARYSDIIDRVADLETRLMDSKIADRASGLLNGRTNPDPGKAIAKHVEGVLRPTPTRRILEQALLDLEEEVEERTLVSRAKQILQAVKGISEEDAHAQLRIASRRLRKRLKEVALQIIEEQHRSRGRTA